MPNVFSIADEILIGGFNEEGKDHDTPDTETSKLEA